MSSDFISETLFYATPQDGLLVAAQTGETTGEGRPVLVGSGDRHAFSASRQ